MSADVCAQKCVINQHRVTLSLPPAVVHVSAHLVNVVNFSVSYSDDFPALNLARYRGEVRHERMHILHFILMRALIDLMHSMTPITTTCLTPNLTSTLRMSELGMCQLWLIVCYR